ncbi:hypothetical protein [Photorhabdus laumondii]|uniref:hypothetical protein n=1 Tax=Photorhabdus laumondii TaxID=2218628 RepID=UPI00138B0876|nr:hypothetical protein [Photorhabdus laumondii]NDL48243.1 hypothetical protein [Photorhabdus laumondii subsp. laumondii]
MRRCVSVARDNPPPIYTLWISRCIAAAREQIPGSIDNDVTGVSECSQQRGNLKDNGYMKQKYFCIAHSLSFLCRVGIVTRQFFSRT